MIADDLPTTTNADVEPIYPALVLKPGRERSVRNRHPWLFTGAIRHTEAAENGAIVQVRDIDNEILGYGHYNQHSQIVCRMFEFSNKTEVFSEAYWQSKLDKAFDFRRLYLDTGTTTGFRLLNAEGDNLPGVIIDAYADTAVMQLRTPGTRILAPVLATHLVNRLGFKHVFDKSLAANDDEDTDAQGGWLTDPVGHEIQFLENGLKFYSAPDQGQKTGYYLDQRDNRKCLMGLAAGRDVLDAFTYAGGFGIYALAGGARRVVSVDASEAAVALCRRNVQANFSQEPPHEAVVADCFEYLRQMQPGAFDCIVLDPPAFTKHISTVKKAARGYKDINLSAFRKIRPGGLLFTFSCSQHISKDLFRKIVFGAAADAGRNVRILAQLGQPPDHPVNIFHPEGEYLKGLVLHVD